MPAGTLFVVATPLGNLGDLSLRAAEILRSVPIVAAEDTRHTRGLLQHIGASPRLLSFHAHSPERRTALLLELLSEGRDVALVSDAGTPTISDPGADLVAAVRGAGMTVVPIPGVSAVATALSVSGLPADRHLFLGFLPRKGKERERLIRQAAEFEWSVVLYEAPPRLGALLADLAEAAGVNRTVVVARELTKLHEEIRSSTLGEAAEYFAAHPPRGELTIVLEGAGYREDALPTGPDTTALAAELLAGGMTRKAVVQHLIKTVGLPRNDAYRLVMELP
jgi:16S rRNA (cytidine1402-2'-O)-methyltransferase